MRSFRLLLLALLFALTTSASAMASVHKCCPNLDCDIAHCIDMGCAPALPAFAVNTPAAPPAIRTTEIAIGRATPRPADLFEEVWTPPD